MSEIQTEDGSEYQVIVGSTRGHLPAHVLLGNKVSLRVEAKVALNMQHKKKMKTFTIDG